MQSEIERSTTPARAAGWVLLATSVLSVAAMAHHPTVHAHGTAALLDELALESGAARLVHGALIVLLGLQVLAYGFVADRLGREGWLVRGGALAYGAGAACLVGAALVNGFVSGWLAQRLGARPSTDPETVRTAFVALHGVNQTLAVAGSLALATAIAAWSTALLRRRGAGRSARVAGVAGLGVGSVTAAGLLSGHLHLDVHGMGAVVLAWAAWGVLVAFWMIQPGRRGFAGL